MLNSPEMMAWGHKNSSFTIVLIALSFTVFCTLLCNDRIGRKVPFNYCLLGFYTLSQGYLLGLSVDGYLEKDVLSSLLLACGAFFGMSYYAASTPSDITVFYSWISGVFMCLLTMIVLATLDMLSASNTLISFFCVLVAILYVAADTQIIMNGRKYGISYDDFVKASLMLYVDFLRLFVSILELLGNKN